MPSPEELARDEAEQRLAGVLADAAAGRFPPPDGVTEVLASPNGRIDAVVAFTAHHLVAADVDADWVRAALAGDDLGAPMRAELLTRLGERLASPAGALDVVLAAPGGGHRSDLELGDGADPADPRLDRARRHRRDVRCLEDVEVA